MGRFLPSSRFLLLAYGMSCLCDNILLSANFCAVVINSPPTLSLRPSYMAKELPSNALVIYLQRSSSADPRCINRLLSTRAVDVVVVDGMGSTRSP